MPRQTTVLAVAVLMMTFGAIRAGAAPVAPPPLKDPLVGQVVILKGPGVRSGDLAADNSLLNLKPVMRLTVKIVASNGNRVKIGDNGNAGWIAGGRPAPRCSNRRLYGANSCESQG